MTTEHKSYLAWSVASEASNRLGNLLRHDLGTPPSKADMGKIRDLLFATAERMGQPDDTEDSMASYGCIIESMGYIDRAIASHRLARYWIDRARETLDLVNRKGGAA